MDILSEEEGLGNYRVLESNKNIGSKRTSNYDFKNLPGFRLARMLYCMF